MSELWWVPDDEEVWTIAVQSSAVLPNGCINYLIKKSNKLMAYPKEKCLSAANMSAMPEDLVLLSEVNQASILACTRLRFERKKIYTGLGTVLMSVNPFEKINGLYGSDIIRDYRNPFNKNLPAHVYLIPSRAYHNMCESTKNQSILISGESGAGKTEATKQCLAFLTTVADAKDALQSVDSITPNRQKKVRSSLHSALHQASAIANRIIAASPILEAFGNAKTVKNPNSSRFGKWMVLHFDSNNVINSSTITSYLLEKSRVTQRDNRERNYHVFYQVLRGVDPAVLKTWNIAVETYKYRYLLQDAMKEAPNLNDLQHYNETYASFLKMGFSPEDTLTVFRIICGILLIGNILFVPTQDGEGSDVKNKEVVESVANLLGIKANILIYALCTRSIETGKGLRKSLVSVQLNNQKAIEARDSLARSVYDRLFLDIIHRINRNSRLSVITQEATGQLKSHSNPLNKDSLDWMSNSTELMVSSSLDHPLKIELPHESPEAETLDEGHRSIGLLDIFGFEIFVENSFEQLCINYCNEILQNHFNFVIFTTEKNYYTSEGIVCDSIEFKDNAAVIKEIEHLFRSLDEEGRIPKGTSKTWYEKLKRGPKTLHVQYSNRKDVFIVKHYAGDVEYSPAAILDKNIEVLSNDLVSTMNSSSNPSVLRIFVAHGSELSPPQSPPLHSGFAAGGGEHGSFSASRSFNNNFVPSRHSSSATGPSSTSMIANKSISWKFVNQLTALMNMLKNTESHFIRCIKSNEQCQPNILDSILVYKQLLYSGVFEVVKIQQSGLPCRLLHRDFLDRYRCLVPSQYRYQLSSPKDLLLQLRSNGFELPIAQMGVTMTFFKGHEQRTLETSRDSLFKHSSSKIQCWLMKVCCSYIYKKMVPKIKDFHQKFDDLNLEGVQETYSSILSDCESLYRLVGWEILAHFTRQLRESINLVRRRSVLLADAERQLKRRTVPGILSLNEVISRAMDLEMTHHSIIIECKRMLQQYYKALEFASFIDYQRLAQLSIANVNEGIESLLLFSDVIVKADEYIETVSEHKRKVDCEIQEMLGPLQVAFNNSLLKYDAATGDLLDADTQSVNQGHTLTDMVKSFENREFISKDLQSLFADCQFFLVLRNHLIPAKDASGVIDQISNYKSSNPLLLVQFEEIKHWADIQLSSLHLNIALSSGRVPKSDTGSEDPVETEAVQELLDKLKALSKPSNAIMLVITVGTWIVKLREAFKAADWDLLEQLVMSADRERHANSDLFHEFPQCLEELDNCQWQVIYHGLLADLIFVLKDPVFAYVSIDSDSYIDLVVDVPENMILIDTVKSFASHRCSPILMKLVPFLESMLQLRSFVYKKDVDRSKRLHRSIPVHYSDLILEYDLQDVISEDFAICHQLIVRMDLEIDLQHALNYVQAGVYPYMGKNNQHPYSKYFDVSESCEDLSFVLQQFEKLSAKFDPLLQNNLELAKGILLGRTYLMKSEMDTSVNWDEVLIQYTNAMKQDPLQTCPASLESLVTEFEITRDEFNRRILLQGYLKILNTPCVKGAIDVDVHVVEEDLLKLFNSYNELTHRMQSQASSSSVSQYPDNLMALKSFTAVILKTRQQVLENQWDAIPALLDRLETIPHGSGRLLDSVEKEMAKIRGEVNAKKAIQLMRHALETFNLNINSNWLEDSIESKLNVSLLKEGIKAIENNQGPISGELRTLAFLVLSVIDALLPKNTIIDQNKMEQVAALYKKYKLDSRSMEEVFQFIRIHNFLRNLFHKLNECGDDSERLMIGAHEIKESIKELPRRYIPWSKAIYIYGDLLNSLSSDDWQMIVEKTHAMEKCIVALRLEMESGSTTNSEANYEDLIITILQKKKVFGYQEALRKKHIMESKQMSGDTETVQPEEALKLKYRKEDEENPYGIFQLRIAGYEDSAILSMSFPTKYFWAYDFSPELLRKKGFLARKLLDAGYSVNVLYSAGYSVSKLRAAGCGLMELREIGVSLEKLRLGGYSEMEILTEAVPIESLRKVEPDVCKLVRLGIPTKDLIAAGFTIRELLSAGFTASQLHNAGIDNARDLFEGGYDLARLRSAGFDCKEFRSCGFDYDTLLQSGGFDEEELFLAGFEYEVQRHVLENFFEMLGESTWKTRLNWCSEKPLKDWFGIGVDIDLDGNERVSKIELSDNNLRGKLSKKLWMLTKLKLLRLNHNHIHGTIPNRLAHSIINHSIITDFSNNPHLDLTALQFSATQLYSVPVESNGTGTHSMTSYSSSMANISSYGHLHPHGIGNGLQIVTSLPSSPDHLPKHLMSSFSTTMLSIDRECNTHCGNDEGISDQERNVLIELFSVTKGKQWKCRRNWCTSKPVKEWFGVSIDAQKKCVIKLCLPSNNLQSVLPDSVCSLAGLKELDLRFNKLHGSIPPTIGWLSQLEKLYLQNNRFDGEVPSNIGKLSRLSILDIRSNALVGEIAPETFSHLHQLKYFGLHSNKLTVTVRTELSDLGSIEKLTPLSIYSNPNSIIAEFKKYLPGCKIVI